MVLAAVGAAGLILTLLVSLLLGRSINRRLTTLRRSALTLAQEQLPSVVARLRRGESVDVAAEAPPLRVGSDEIGQVGQAIDTVRQTAIRSAIDEARVRQGVNDMFRNLARRNQSLLQRQLTVLDEMERRATDPDVLEDLFKMDHLTTRMRRHAEGLIILSGAPPGRSWSAPVKLVDVMRGAVAEVEDYARVTVSTQSRAALAGSAVTDLIHLLAELIENATSLSPPFTQVRVGGETVANGFAIEIEDRGLGMAPQRLQELNERLAHPPDINPANTEQLGLFVVGQLARRHGVRVMLRPSPYGGTTAVVLIPLTLIVEEGPAAITSGGRRARATADAVPSRAVSRLRTAALTAAITAPTTPAATPTAPRAPGRPCTGRRGRWPGGNGTARHGPPPTATAPRRRRRPAAPAPRDAGPARASRPTRAATARETRTRASRPIRTRRRAAAPGEHRQLRRGRGLQPARRRQRGSGSGGTRRQARTARHRRRSGRDRGAGRPAATPPEFDVFTPIRRAEQDGSPPPTPRPRQSHPDFSGQAADPYASPYGSSPEPPPTRKAALPFRTAGATEITELTEKAEVTEMMPLREQRGRLRELGGDPAGGGTKFQGPAAPCPSGQSRTATAASAAAASSQGSTGVPPATAASLADMRNTLSAMQRGWQQGRSQTQRDTED